MEILELMEKTINEIREIASPKLSVAFSGGKDSTLVAALAKEALGPENVNLINVSFGAYSYSRGLEIVSRCASNLGLELRFVPANTRQQEIWKHGPSCNRCTRQAKLFSVKTATDRLVATGANQSDTWGQTGIVVRNGFYAPIRDWQKTDIDAALKELGIAVERIGEAPVREGCKLKHLLKIMANPGYHGYAVSIANEVLLDNLEGVEHSLANVKIIGPLSKNIALVNVLPYPGEKIEKRIVERLNEIDAIDEVHFVKKPLILDVSANPGVYGSDYSKGWVLKGRLQPEFASEIKLNWYKSSNTRLTTFHVVGYRQED